MRFYNYDTLAQMTKITKWQGMIDDPMTILIDTNKTMTKKYNRVI